MAIRALQCVLALVVLSTVSATHEYDHKRQLRQQAPDATSAPMTLADNGTYLTTITLEGTEVLLRVDTTVVGVWVSCVVWSNESCITDYDLYEAEYDSLGSLDSSLTYYNTKRFETATVGGLDYVGLDVKVAYSDFPSIPDAAQGILGLAANDFGSSSPLILDGQLEVISLTLGATSETSTLTFNGYDTTQTDKSKYSTAVEMNKYSSAYDDWALYLDCASLPLADGSKDTTCSGSGFPRMNLNVPWINVDAGMLDTFDRRFATSCTFTDGTYYICDASVALPRLTLSFSGGWDFYLEVEDYVEQIPESSPAQVKVLLTTSVDSYDWVLGAPFMKKYYSSMNLITRFTTIFCEEGKTCKKNDEYLSEGDGYGEYPDYGDYDTGGDYDDDYDDYDYDTNSWLEDQSKKTWMYGLFGALGFCLFVGACTWYFKTHRKDTKEATPVTKDEEVTGTETVPGQDSSDMSHEDTPVTVVVGSESNSGVYQTLQTPKTDKY